MKRTAVSSLVFVLLATPIWAEDLSSITPKALAEGALTLTGMSHGICSFGPIIASFSEKYPEITVTELTPEATSEDQLAMLRAARDNPGPDAPDVINVDYDFGPVAKAEGLLLPFIANNLNEMTAPTYDGEIGDRSWGGAYFFVPALLINTDLVPNPPTSWADLSKPEYAGQVAFPASPSASPLVAMAVLSAGRAVAKPDQNAAQLGFDLFAALASVGNLAPVPGTPATVADGTTPILVLSDADALRARDAMAGTTALAVVVPMKGVTADVHVQAISATAPHPNAAKLWLEHLYTDRIQIDMLRGYCHPILWLDFANWDEVPLDLMEGKPPNIVYSLAYFPTLQERLDAEEIVSSQWDAVIGSP